MVFSSAESRLCSEWWRSVRVHSLVLIKLFSLWACVFLNYGVAFLVFSFPELLCFSRAYFLILVNDILSMCVLFQMWFETNFVNFKEFCSLMTWRWIKVCFQPWCNPLWLTGLKVTTNRQTKLSLSSPCTHSPVIIIISLRNYSCHCHHPVHLVVSLLSPPCTTIPVIVIILYT